MMGCCFYYYYYHYYYYLILFNILFSKSGHINMGMTNVDPNSIVKPEEKCMGKGRIILK